MKEPLFAEFPVSEYKFRHKRARELMDEYGLDALILTEEENLRYFTGYRTVDFDIKPDFQMFILPRDDKSDGVIIIPMHLVGASKMSCIEDVRHWKGEGPESKEDFRGGPVDTVVDTIKYLKSDKGKIGMELGAGTRLAMNIMQFGKLRDSLPDAQILDCSELLENLRGVKSTLEINTMRKALEITCAGYKAGLSALREGISEREICNIMCSEMIRFGGDFNAFGYNPWLIVTQSGFTNSWCDCITKESVLKKGDLFLVDGGVIYKGYHTDIIRMGSIGEPTKEQRKMYETTVSANDAAISVIKPGVTPSVVCNTGFDVFRESGYGHLIDIRKKLGYDTGGHGIGLALHEKPIIRLSNEEPLKEGMIIALEFFIADNLPFDKMKDFISIEQVAVVTSDGYEVLSNMSKELFIG